MTEQKSKQIQTILANIEKITKDILKGNNASENRKLKEKLIKLYLKKEYIVNEDQARLEIEQYKSQKIEFKALSDYCFIKLDLLNSIKEIVLKKIDCKKDNKKNKAKDLSIILENRHLQAIQNICSENGLKITLTDSAFADKSYFVE